MRSQISSVFVRSAGVLLGLTGVAKFVSAFGTARVLEVPDPVFGLRFTLFLLLVDELEIIIAWICLRSEKLKVCNGLLAWIATVIFLYRATLWRINYHGPCLCLGSLTDMLRIPTGVADIAMQVILGYLLIGSYGLLLTDYLAKRPDCMETPGV